MLSTRRRRPPTIPGMRRTVLVIAGTLLTAGCTASAPQPAAAPATPPPAPATPTPPSPAEQAAAPAPAAESGNPSASVEEFAAEGDETRAKILFVNPTAHSCEFRSYTLIWPGGKKRVDAKAFHVSAGGKRERSLRIHKNDGDISSLNKGSAHVEIETDCGGS